nr:hypothetical protein GCM10020241_66960 [Streptoalloteichus tenebrarius]
MAGRQQERGDPSTGGLQGHADLEKLHQVHVLTLTEEEGDQETGHHDAHEEQKRCANVGRLD